MTLKTQIARNYSTWHYANSQNKAISLKPIHFIDNIKLILIPPGRNSTTHLTLVPEVNTILKTTDSNPTPQSLILHLKKVHPKIMSKFYEGNLFRGISNRSSCTRKSCQY